MNTSKLKKEISILKETLTRISEIVGEPPSDDSVETELCMSISNIMDEIAIMDNMVS